MKKTTELSLINAHKVAEIIQLCGSFWTSRWFNLSGPLVHFFQAKWFSRAVEVNVGSWWNIPASLFISVPVTLPSFGEGLKIHEKKGPRYKRASRKGFCPHTPLSIIYPEWWKADPNAWPPRLHSTACHGTVLQGMPREMVPCAEKHWTYREPAKEACELIMTNADFLLILTKQLELLSFSTIMSDLTDR